MNRFHAQAHVGMSESVITQVTRNDANQSSSSGSLKGALPAPPIPVHPRTSRHPLFLNGAMFPPRVASCSARVSPQAAFIPAHRPHPRGNTLLCSWLWAPCAGPRQSRWNAFFSRFFCCVPSSNRRSASVRRAPQPTAAAGNVWPSHPDPGQNLLPAVSQSDQGKKCLVLDLDETLVHSSFQPVPNPDFIVPIEIDGKIHHVYVLKRPHVDQFLERVGELFEVVLFTASLSKVRTQKQGRRAGGGGASNKHSWLLVLQSRLFDPGLSFIVTPEPKPSRLAPRLTLHSMQIRYPNCSTSTRCSDTCFSASTVSTTVATM